MYIFLLNSRKEISISCNNERDKLFSIYIIARPPDFVSYWVSPLYLYEEVTGEHAVTS